MFRNIIITVRNLRRNGVYSLINIVGLAMSLATCAFIVLWVQDETSVDTFHKDAKNMYAAQSNFKMEGMEMNSPVVNGMFGQVAREDFAGSVDAYCRIRSWNTGYMLNGNTKSSMVDCYYE